MTLTVSELAALLESSHGSAEMAQLAEGGGDFWERWATVLLPRLRGESDDVAEWAAIYDRVFAALADGELAVRPKELRLRMVAALSADPDGGESVPQTGEAVKT